MNQSDETPSQIEHMTNNMENSCRVWELLMHLSPEELSTEPQLHFRLLEDVGLDSLSFVELLLNLEEIAGTQITESEFYNRPLKTVEDIVALLDHILVSR